MNKTSTLVGSAPSRVRHFRSSRNLLLESLVPSRTNSQPYSLPLFSANHWKCWQQTMADEDILRRPLLQLSADPRHHGLQVPWRGWRFSYSRPWLKWTNYRNTQNSAPTILFDSPSYFLLILALEYINTHIYILLCVLFIWCPFFIWFLTRGGRKADPCDMYRHHRADDAEEHVSGANGQLARGQRNCRSRLDCSR